MDLIEMSCNIKTDKTKHWKVGYIETLKHWISFAVIKFTNNEWQQISIVCDYNALNFSLL